MTRREGLCQCEQTRPLGGVYRFRLEVRETGGYLGLGRVGEPDLRDRIKDLVFFGDVLAEERRIGVRRARNLAAFRLAPVGTLVDESRERLNQVATLAMLVEHDGDWPLLS